MGTWGLRRTAPELATRYEADGLWTDETLGELADAGLRDAPALELRVWSSARPSHATFGEVHDKARRLAAGLRRRGVDPGDVVAFQLPNCEEAAVVFFGAALCGAVVVPIVHFYGPHEVGYILRDSGARILVTADRFGQNDYLHHLAGLVPELDDLRLVAVVRFDAGGATVGDLDIEVLEFTDLLAADPIAAPIHVDPNRPALLAYTSGTTAHPKGVIHTHHSIVAEVHQLGALQPPDPRPLLNGAPVGHAIGMLGGLLLPVYRGRSIHLIDVWDPSEILRAMIDAELTGGSGATYFLTSLLDAPDFAESHVENMRYVGLGGSSVPDAVADRAAALGISIARSYGSTEHPSITGSEHHEPMEKRARSDGQPLAGVELRIVDPDGRDLPVGSPGEIWSRGPDLCAGYTDAALTPTVFEDDGWYRTGDVGVLDAEGWLTITDRLSDIIIRGGENISAAEVENALLSMPGVVEAAVAAAPDDRLGEHAAAIVRTDPPGRPPSIPAIQEHLRQVGLAKQKWPEEVHASTELPGHDFPRTPTGKIKKHELRRWLGERS